MNLTDTLLDPGWYWLAWFVWLAFFGRAVLRAPWRRLQDSEQLNVWLGMIVLLILVWCLEAGVRPGLGMHLLGATIFTLSFGPSLAFIGLSLVMAGVALNSSAGLLVFAINALFTAGVGVVLSQSLYRLFLVVFPRHFFIFCLCLCFCRLFLCDTFPWVVPTKYNKKELRLRIENIAVE